MTPLAPNNVAATTTTDYCGNIIYENGAVSKVLTEEGYITLPGTIPTYHYYLKDHQGNNRVVIDNNGTVEQVNHYYPFGGLFGDNTGGDVQPYKYNGKELDRMHGLDLFDYGARHYDAAIGRWGTMDPHAENYYSWSPYAYVGDNPIIRTDPTGKDWWTTSDSTQIANFINSVGSGQNVHDFSGWEHHTKKPKDIGLLGFDDVAGQFYMMTGDVAKSFDTNIKPGLTSEGMGYSGAFVYEYEGPYFWRYAYKFAYDFTPFSNFIGPIDPSRYGEWSVDDSGRIIGITPVTGYAPMAGKGKGNFGQGGKVKMGKAKGNMTGNRNVQQKQFDSVVRELKLTKDQANQLHKAIHGQGYGYQEILQEGKYLFNK